MVSDSRDYPNQNTGPERIELPLSVLETAVLPLNYDPVCAKRLRSFLGLLCLEEGCKETELRYFDSSPFTHSPLGSWAIGVPPCG